MEQEKRREKTLHRIITEQKGGSFQAGGKTNLINKDTAPLSVGIPYMDPWANPLMVKGVPKDQKQLMDSTRTMKPLFTAPFTPLAQPFFPRSGGNRSTVLPNDVFDTIAEAEETGGAAQRFRGTTTSRFGLSANMDNRTDGTIPKPPIRTSAIQSSTKTTYVPLRCCISHVVSLKNNLFLCGKHFLNALLKRFPLLHRLHKMTLKLKSNGNTAAGLPVNNRTRVGGDTSSVHSHTSYSNDAVDSSDEEEL